MFRKGFLFRPFGGNGTAKKLVGCWPWSIFLFVSSRCRVWPSECYPKVFKRGLQRFAELMKCIRVFCFRSVRFLLCLCSIFCFLLPFFLRVTHSQYRHINSGMIFPVVVWERYRRTLLPPKRNWWLWYYYTIILLRSINTNSRKALVLADANTHF